LKFAARTDRGRHRELNEDCFNIISGYSGVPEVFIVADGMGGHNSGEIASKTAVDFITGAILSSPGRLAPESAGGGEIKKLVEETNRYVYEKSLEAPENNGMGTTMTVAAAVCGTMYIGHVGDSRLYLIRNGNIKLISTDHSYIEEMVRNGSMTREEAKSHPRKHVITRALGCSAEVEADAYSFSMEDGDTYLLCTDGLTNMLGEDEILELAGENAPDAACEALVKSANDNGGEDNITVIVIKNE
jgi:serine/threonine protein phosphatase PrpC